MTVSSPNPLHDEINLVRLMRRLEKTVAGHQNLSPKDVTLREWVKVQGTLQKVKFARGLIKRVELYGEDPDVVNRMDVVRTKLDEMDVVLSGIQEPPRTRPTPILPTIPQPPSPSSLTLDLPSLPSQPEQQHEETATETQTQADDLLLPADTLAFPSSISFAYPTPMTLIPSTLAPSSSTTATSTATAIATGAVPRFLQNSNALQQELSDQLAAMAAQLKRNTTHFSETLARDQSVVDETMVKLEGNLDVMGKRRIRLRDHRGKSSGTTCLVVMIVVVVLLLFVCMVGVIRLTRV
ncbi:hypothetical protein H0H92_008483 [Tricholoma furcatifolium]|nr:hypothetical protein H0H92_008483 [Tricholoma furcatifolium]